MMESGRRTWTWRSRGKFTNEYDEAPAWEGEESATRRRHGARRRSCTASLLPLSYFSSVNLHLNAPIQSVTILLSMVLHCIAYAYNNMNYNMQDWKSKRSMECDDNAFHSIIIHQKRAFRRWCQRMKVKTVHHLQRHLIHSIPEPPSTESCPFRSSRPDTKPTRQEDYFFLEASAAFDFAVPRN